MDTITIQSAQYLLSSISQAFAALIGAVLAVSLALAQLGRYRIPLTLWLRRSVPDWLYLLFVAFVLVYPLWVLATENWASSRFALVVFVLAVVSLPLAIWREVRRTSPLAYLRVFVRHRHGAKKYGEYAGDLLIETARLHDERAFGAIALALSQMRDEMKTERQIHTWYGMALGSQLPRVLDYAIDTGDREVLRWTFMYLALALKQQPGTNVLEKQIVLAYKARDWIGWHLPARLAYKTSDLTIESRFRSNSIYHYESLMQVGQVLASRFALRANKPFPEWAAQPLADFLANMVHELCVVDVASKYCSVDPLSEGERYYLKWFTGWLQVLPVEAVKSSLRGLQVGMGMGVYRVNTTQEYRERCDAINLEVVPIRAEAANLLVQAYLECAVGRLSAGNREAWPLYVASGVKCCREDASVDDLLLRNAHCKHHTCIG